ncbi:hypothetical protein GCM10010342_77880 [Streptomyces anulatus]|nr:hypothetical protein GCM10010342_77880 [Streptomyces anulatus]
MSLLPDVVRREAFAEASRFRGEFYECLTARRDEVFELTDAVLCAYGAVKSPVDLTLLPEHRRGHGAIYGGLNRSRSTSIGCGRCCPGCRCRVSTGPPRTRTHSRNGHVPKPTPHHRQAAPAPPRQGRGR